MSDRELEMQEDDNLVTEEEVTLEIAGYRAVDDSELCLLYTSPSPRD